MLTQLLNRLYSANLFAEKNGLENMRSLCAHAGHPEQKYKSVHVAGSNGKGSVSTKIATGLQVSGYKVGLFTSPHIDRFNERIKIDGVDISDEQLERYLEIAFKIADEAKIPATYFELVTLIAFLYYAEQKVDYAVFEAGLGGRFDATNVIIPLVSVITSISLEHTEILGDTIEKITLEKAGIIKSGVPIVIGPTVPIQFIASKTALVEAVEDPFDTFFEENNAVAKRAMEILGIQPIAIEKALKASPPFRMEILQDEVTIIRDVGHNPGAVEQLLIALEKKHGWKRFHMMCSFSSNKDFRSCFQLLQPACETMTLLEPTHARLATVQAMKDALPVGMEHIPFSFHQLRDLAKRTGHPILITGSFYIDLKALGSVI
jgi:dihydrofolate synthase/folylpolyglutamate synthase